MKTQINMKKKSSFCGLYEYQFLNLKIFGKHVKKIAVPN